MSKDLKEREKGKHILGRGNGKYKGPEVGQRERGGEQGPIMQGLGGDWNSYSHEVEAMEGSQLEKARSLLSTHSKQAGQGPLFVPNQTPGSPLQGWTNLTLWS